MGRGRGRGGRNAAVADPRGHPPIGLMLDVFGYLYTLNGVSRRPRLDISHFTLNYE